MRDGIRKRFQIVIRHLEFRRALSNAEFQARIQGADFFFRVLAVGYVHNAAANEISTRGGQANQRNFALNFLPREVAVDPFKSRLFGAESLVELDGRRFSGGPSVRLKWRADLHGT